YVSDPTTVVSIHQPVPVKVVSIDRERTRIGLTMRLD
ncbi:MAG: S1 RNA-binding domain-containing protein, partial [Bacteroides sp.]|nr:S1 RNA-binding domain-containing protein [Bacteroides sp.]